MKPAGKITILVLTILLAGGIWGWYGHVRTPHLAPLPSSALSQGGGGDVILITSATKMGWLEDQVGEFNAQNGGGLKIAVRYIETRAAMHSILAGAQQPVLWSPSSPIWAQRLADAWNDPKYGHPGVQNPVSVDDPAAVRVYLESPIVFMTTIDRARTLRPLLGGSDPWGSLRSFSMGHRTLPGLAGPFRFAHADPLNANSGFLTMAMILADYARNHGTKPEVAANSVDFGKYLTELEHGFVYDEPVRAGSSAVFKAFLDDMNRYTLITTYESNALQAAASHPNIAVIYPTPCVNSEQTVVAMSGSWVTAQQKQIASDFMTFLARPDAIADGVKNDFRSSASFRSIASLDSQLNAHQSQGFQTGTVPEPLPSYDALNDAACTWQSVIAHE